MLYSLHLVSEESEGTKMRDRNVRFLFEGGSILIENVSHIQWLPASRENLEEVDSFFINEDRQCELKTHGFIQVVASGILGTLKIYAFPHNVEILPI